MTDEKRFINDWTELIDSEFKRIEIEAVEFARIRQEDLKSKLDFKFKAKLVEIQKYNEEIMQKVDAERKIKQEAEEQRKKLAKEAREQDKAHRGIINNYARESLVENGIDFDLATIIVKLIAQKKVKNITMNY